MSDPLFPHGTRVVEKSTGDLGVVVEDRVLPHLVEVPPAGAVWVRWDRYVQAGVQDVVAYVPHGSHLAVVQEPALDDFFIEVDTTDSGRVALRVAGFCAALMTPECARGVALDILKNVRGLRPDLVALGHFGPRDEMPPDPPTAEEPPPYEATCRNPRHRGRGVPRRGDAAAPLADDEHELGPTCGNSRPDPEPTPPPTQ